MKGQCPLWEAERGLCRPSAGGWVVQEHQLRKRRFEAEHPMLKSCTFSVAPASQGLWFGLISRTLSTNLPLVKNIFFMVEFK